MLVMMVMLKEFLNKFKRKRWRWDKLTQSRSFKLKSKFLLSACIQVALHPAQSFQEPFIHENCRLSYLSILTLKTDNLCQHNNCLYQNIAPKQLLESKCCSRSPCPVLWTRTSIADINCVHRNSLSRYHPFVHPSASSSSRSRYHEHHPSNLNFCNCATNLWWFSHGWRVVKKQEEVITSSCFLTTLQLWLLYSSSFLLRVFSGSWSRKDMVFLTQKNVLSLLFRLVKICFQLASSFSSGPLLTVSMMMVMNWWWLLSQASTPIPLFFRGLRLLPRSNISDISIHLVFFL